MDGKDATNEFYAQHQMDLDQTESQIPPLPRGHDEQPGGLADEEFEDAEHAVIADALAATRSKIAAAFSRTAAAAGTAGVHKRGLKTEARKPFRAASKENTLK